PLMGIIGAVLVSRWSFGLMKSTSAVLLDEQLPEERIDSIIKTVETETSARVTDLHIWQIGPDMYAAEMVVAAANPNSADFYKQHVSAGINIVHLTCEILHLDQES
ncbi:MAG: cation transporter, partial [Limisphaerales bacterium]